MLMVNCAPDVRPESNPPPTDPLAARYVQGSSKDD